MNREEYLKRLSFLLKDLPEEEIEDAIAYYEDYFEEAGEEKEEQVIKKLGSPEKIAKMIRDSVQENQASSEYTEEGYRQETYEDYQQMSRKDSQKEAKQGSRWHMKGRRNRNIILMILIVVFVGSWLIPGIFGIVIGIAGGIFGGRTTHSRVSCQSRAKKYRQIAASALSLFVLRIFTDNSDTAFSLNNLALLANRFY